MIRIACMRNQWYGKKVPDMNQEEFNECLEFINSGEPVLLVNSLSDLDGIMEQEDIDKIEMV